MANWNSFTAFLDEAERTPVSGRQALVDALMAERRVFPWIEGRRATFVYVRDGAESVALNLDTIPSDPPFAPFTRLDGTTLWYLTQEFDTDALLDYLLAVNDPGTPLAQERDVVGRIARFWGVDPLNPTRMDTAQMNVSVLRMSEARPFPDWGFFSGVARGRVDEHSLGSTQLGFAARKLWVYTPAGYANSGRAYPLVILHDGQWATGPLQAPYIADVLIKHGRMAPAIIAMIQSGAQDERTREYVSNDRHYLFLLTELLPFIQTQYRVDSTRVGVGGVAMGALAAAHAALNNPVVFSTLAMISPPLGKGQLQDQLLAYTPRFENNERLPERIFQSVGRYEARGRFVRPAHELRDLLNRRAATSDRRLAYHYEEIASGHGLVGFRSILPEALAWLVPGDAV